VEYQKILAFEFTPYRLKPQCLVFAITGEHTESGNPLLVRNHEWLEEDSESLRVLTIKPNKKLASYGFTFGWSLASRYGGINEAGLAISGASTSFEYTNPGVMFNAAMRWILDNCKTSEEAVEFIKSIPKVWGMNYLMIDRKRTIAKLETHKEKTIVTYPKGFDLTTLTYEAEEMRKLNPNVSENILELFAFRRKFLDNWFRENRGSITEEAIIEILRNCENKLHYHNKGPDGTYGTCWSYILSPKSNKALISVGPPCKNDFSPYTIDFDF
jgi:predicted choloylglycine hydrolase